MNNYQIKSKAKAIYKNLWIQIHQVYTDVFLLALVNFGPEKLESSKGQN
jgi:hypothetical protein